MLHGNKNPKNSSGGQVLNHYRILVIFQVGAGGMGWDGMDENTSWSNLLACNKCNTWHCSLVNQSGHLQP